VRNRIWIPFFALNIFFLVMKWYVFPAGQNHDFASYMAHFCSTLTVVFGILNFMGRKKGKVK